MAGPLSHVVYKVGPLPLHGAGRLPSITGPPSHSPGLHQPPSSPKVFPFDRAAAVVGQSRCVMSAATGLRHTPPPPPGRQPAARQAGRQAGKVHLGECLILQSYSLLFVNGELLFGVSLLRGTKSGSSVRCGPRVRPSSHWPSPVHGPGPQSLVTPGISCYPTRPLMVLTKKH